MPDDTLNRRIAERLRGLRAKRGLSLEALARRSGVSRSMISLIERGESSATAVVLERLATALGVMLASLFEAESASPETGNGRVARRGEQPVWRDPASGYQRRNVSPAAAQPVRIVEVDFPAGARVAFETAAREAPVFQQIWLLEGCIDITIGDESHRLGAGDCLAMRLDAPMMFFNPTAAAARYAVVILTTEAA